MATFTVSLKRAIEVTGGTTELMPNGVSKLIGGDIGLQYYPIFDEAHRDTLTGKIIDHYWNREIGFETIDMFKMKMRTTMNNIMPMYNQLYESEILALDPLKTIDISTIATGESLQHVTAEGEGESATVNTSGSRSVSSDTPQVMLSPNADYASAAADVNSKTEGDSTTTETNTSDSETTQTNDSNTSGFQGSQSDLLIRFRETFLNIDMMIINELETLFMQIWNNGDTYTNNEGWIYS